MNKPRFLEILTVAVQILTLILRTAASIVDDAKVYGCSGDIDDHKDSSDESAS